jgi:hypothetical protein
VRARGSWRVAAPACPFEARYYRPASRFRTRSGQVENPWKDEELGTGAAVRAEVPPESPHPRGHPRGRFTAAQEALERPGWGRVAPRACSQSRLRRAQASRLTKRARDHGADLVVPACRRASPVRRPRRANCDPSLRRGALPARPGASRSGSLKRAPGAGLERK